MSLSVATNLPPQGNQQQTPPHSATTLVNPHISRQPSTSSNKGKTPTTRSRKSTLRSQSRPAVNQEGDDSAWGSNFWVTLVDPQSQTSFFACPATGEVSWDAPVGTFVLPPSDDGEWWELGDESRGGLPYYYQTKTGETVWEKPQGFVIPLSILQDNVYLSPSHKPATNGVRPVPRRPTSGDYTGHGKYTSNIKRATLAPAHLEPIPGSPNATDNSSPPSLATKSSFSSERKQVNGHRSVSKELDSPGKKSDRSLAPSSYHSESPAPKARTKSYAPLQPQSLDAALEMLSSSHSDSGHISIPNTSGYSSRHPPKYQPTVGGKGISAPILNHAATLQLSPVKNRDAGLPIVVEPRVPLSGASVTTFPSGTYPILPQALAEDIQQFSESDYAQQYFSTHRRGFIFRRKVPVEQLMTWQKVPLTEPLLNLTRSLHKDAVKIFKVIQHLMGDREREKGINVRVQPDAHVSMIASLNVSTTSLTGLNVGMLEEERWLLSEGLTHGELRDEIYCQLMKQLTGNPSRENVFKGWQLLCVLLLTFPPSKNFETYLHAFIQNHTTQQEGRVDVMAKYCLRRLVSISKKGPRGKPPTVAEIETASDAAFNPSTFGESLDAIIRLQERNYPHQKIPIILPFLSDGILALGGTKAEGIFRVPGDNDSVSALKLRIDRGYYTLDGVDDPHVLASLMKLWLRELCDPLVPDELYNECIQNSKDPEACVQIVERLPTINRRVVLFVISFLQIFLEERTQGITKMTPANLALVMAPNLLRCNSDLVSVVFTNAQYEQIFVYNLLLHLRCDEIDAHYKPAHGLGAAANGSGPRKPRNRSRRPDQ
ncbi:hypothetical protein CPB83DRAFT_929834 [Crepidotus variabilis]|uniref:Rho GTPase-activating protein 39 n=1 Tax=Crepidotus variabilis TaxID=179855 RepID=A0A9P6EG92_9AGAR|nr:hypothetical protein CPB83DRAFT_929834 [Crepidotus variabilis]